MCVCAQETARCPLCRSEIKTSELVEFPQEEMGEENGTNSEKWRTSSKVQRLQIVPESKNRNILQTTQNQRFLVNQSSPEKSLKYYTFTVEYSLTVDAL